MAKYSISDAQARRIALKAAGTGGMMHWKNAVEWMREEGIHGPEGMLSGLVQTMLRLGYPEIAASLGASCAYGLREAREALRAIREGQRALEIVLDDEQ